MIRRYAYPGRTSRDRRAKLGFWCASISGLIFNFVPLVYCQSPVPDSPEIEQRVSSMLMKMNLDEKLGLIGGDNFSTHAVSSIGLPSLKMSDGPYGVRTYGRSTAYAAGISLAAAWDQELARRVGESMGKDARARGVNFLLAPGVNIYRSPLNGRNFEYFGEDPFLSARIAVGFIEGVQSQGVVATVKHFAANNSEFDRHNLNSIVDERTLREIYLPAFEASVREAQVGAVMDSYNLLNGQHLTQNSRMNNDILKNEWGFQGIVMSDWGATYDTVGAANGGLDLEMPTGEFMSPGKLKAALAYGRITKAAIDDKVRRILRTAARFSFFDRPQQDDSISLYDAGGRSVAYDAALASFTLLRNEHGILPLNPAQIHTIAVIGPGAQPAVVGGGGSSEVRPFTSVSFLEGIAQQLGPKVKVLYARGIEPPSSLFWETHFDRLVQQVFPNSDCSGTPQSTTSPGVIADWSPNSESPLRDKRCVLWTGVFTPSRDGPQTFLTAAAGRDSYSLRVNGTKLIVEARPEDQTPQSAEISLRAGVPATIELKYVPDSGAGRIGLGIRPTEDLVSHEAKTIAAHADAVVICAGFDGTTEAEARDRSYDLPYGQAALINAIGAINKRTIVAVTSGGSYATSEWISSAPALLETWYAGQEEGRALAQILFGHSPEGKLPISFESNLKENPAYDNYYPHKEGVVSKPSVEYKEGVFIGYRYYTSMHRPVLFPFGFGLSYTTFRFDHLHIAPVQGSADSLFTVECDITNTGSREGSEVAQLYVGAVSPPVPRPIRELKGFQKVHLAPGQTRRVSFNLDTRSFSYFDPSTKLWKAAKGSYRIQVGSSSVDLPMGTEVFLQ